MHDAFIRLIDLLEYPEDVAVLAPLVQQEICYRLLTGEQGPRLRQTASAGNHAYQIARAINWRRKNFDKPLRIEELADRVGLSASAFRERAFLVARVTDRYSSVMSNTQAGDTPARHTEPTRLAVNLVFSCCIFPPFTVNIRPRKRILSPCRAPLRLPLLEPSRLTATDHIECFQL